MVEDSLPEELWVQILSKIPAESLIRLRCVRKSWLHIINSRPFFIDHLTYHQNNSNRLYLLFHNHNTSFYSLHETNTMLSLEIEFCRDPLFVYGTCNGLVCLSHDCMDMTTSIYLWNPIVRKIKVLPVPTLIFDISSDMVDFDDDDLCTSIYICFGYDDDDYKVIMVGVVEDVSSVGIYSLSTDCWSVIDDCENDDHLDPFTLHNLNSRHSRFLDGVAYFKTTCDDDADNQIVSFDMASKVFREIELPDKFQSFSMDVYDGESLALLTSDVRTNGLGCLSIWFLRYNGEIDSDESVSSWEKIFVIDSSSQAMNSNPLIPVMFVDNGKVLIKVGVKLVVCNLETGEFGELKVEQGMAENISYCLGESLALLGEDNVDVRAMSYQRK